MVLAVLLPFSYAQSTEEEKVLAAFKGMVREHVESYKSNGREYVANLGGGWAKEVFSIDPTSVKFDVDKTSSLVSPFIGTVSFTLIRRYTAFHGTADEAGKDTVLIKKDSAAHTHSFAYQDHKWTPTVRMYRDLDGLLTGESFPCDELLTTGERASKEDIHGCLEEFDTSK